MNDIEKQELQEIGKTVLGIESELKQLFVELAAARQDQARLDWMADNLDDLIIVWDVGNDGRSRTELSFCYPTTGCQVEVKGKTLRAAVDQAIAIGKGLKR